mmetsp:Transcript_9732/g.19456  ORF Transcript_9732/g.19456 Transcript_9732/m.19456 type:complete len:188 (-) Transcript_9732:74-637(-)|eukprot:CAMPEP_0181343476 /NCGR_PEP_ID=MMETSP1101-20121128/31607_1 /TAXON_ID=46948 /ORGANISM="Rhodomonas abbreviata, Strain Caron Lab Isolate" /LENGTH=187 /DNA_ID=CAMNT_0023455109 /DNA_START=105 /DNA_END=668 /DNA_ORIENTATION=-
MNNEYTPIINAAPSAPPQPGIQPFEVVDATEVYPMAQVTHQSQTCNQVHPSVLSGTQESRITDQEVRYQGSYDGVAILNTDGEAKKKSNITAAINHNNLNNNILASNSDRVDNMGAPLPASLLQVQPSQKPFVLSANPMATKESSEDATQSKETGCKTSGVGDGGYEVSEYKISDYTTQDYKSIYDK